MPTSHNYKERITELILVATMHTNWIQLVLGRNPARFIGVQIDDFLFLQFLLATAVYYNYSIYYLSHDAIMLIVGQELRPNKLNAKRKSVFLLITYEFF